MSDKYLQSRLLEVALAGLTQSRVRWKTDMCSTLKVTQEFLTVEYSYKMKPNKLFALILFLKRVHSLCQLQCRGRGRGLSGHWLFVYKPQLLEISYHHSIGRIWFSTNHNFPCDSPTFSILEVVLQIPLDLKDNFKVKLTQHRLFQKWSVLGTHFIQSKNFLYHYLIIRIKSDMSYLFLLSRFFQQGDIRILSLCRHHYYIS